MTLRPMKKKFPSLFILAYPVSVLMQNKLHHQEENKESACALPDIFACRNGEKNNSCRSMATQGGLSSVNENGLNC